MRFECYQHWEQLPASVESLFALSSKQSMFLTREWFDTLHGTAFDKGETLLLATVVDHDQVLALLPLVGDGVHRRAFSHRYTARFSLLLASKEAEVLLCLVQGLEKMPVDAIELSPVADDDSNLLALGDVLEKRGYTHHQHFFFYNWVHRTAQESFERYMAARPARLRNTIDRKRRKLAREHGYDIHMFRGDEVRSGLVDYHEAYSSSWKANEQYVALLDALAINMSTRDWTRLAILYIDGCAAAAQLWFVVENKASIFRLAYDERWKKYSPGSILTAYLMEYVIDVDKVEEIDFLTGNEAYKQDWMSERRQRFRVLFVRPRRVCGKSATYGQKIRQLFSRIRDKAQR